MFKTIISTFLIILLSVFLVACSNDNQENSKNLDNTHIQNNHIDKQTTQEHVQKSKNTNNKEKSTDNQFELQINNKKQDSKLNYLKSPEVQAPPEKFTPSYRAVQKALADVLTQTVINMKPSKERTQWYKQQIQTLKTLQVYKCNMAQVRTPATCLISLGNKKLEIKLILTQEDGWVIIK